MVLVAMFKGTVQLIFLIYFISSFSLFGPLNNPLKETIEFVKVSKINKKNSLDGSF